jgi:hypothetical protein
LIELGFLTGCFGCDQAELAIERVGLVVLRDLLPASFPRSGQLRQIFGVSAYVPR